MVAIIKSSGVCCAVAAAAVIGLASHAVAQTDLCGAMRQHKAQTGRAVWYAPRYEGQPTSSGEPYDPGAMTAAHPTLPLGTKVRVTNRRNGLSTILRINDRGPYTKGRIIDLSEAAAEAIGAKRDNALVRVRVLCPNTSKIDK